ncbi:MAG: hypothetical protein AAGA72_13605 [Pseudomonadota bacterium]
MSDTEQNDNNLSLEYKSTSDSDSEKRPKVPRAAKRETIYYTAIAMILASIASLPIIVPHFAFLLEFLSNNNETVRKELLGRFYPEGFSSKIYNDAIKLFTIFSLSYLVRKLAFAEVDWRNATADSVGLIVKESLNQQRGSLKEFRDILMRHEGQVSETLRKTIDEVDSRIFESKVVFLESEEKWYARAIEVILGWEGYFPSTQERVIRAVSTFIYQEEDQIGRNRRDYLRAIARIICGSSETNPYYQLIMVPHPDDPTEKAVGKEIRKRIQTLNEISQDIDTAWGKENITVKKAHVSGIDLVIVGDVVLFNLKTVSGGITARRGVLIEDNRMARAFTSWFDQIFTNPDICKTLNMADARRWGISEEDLIKLGGTTQE